MNLRVVQIAELVGGEIHGDEAAVIESVASLKNAGPQDLTYAEAKFRDEITQSRAGCIIVQSGPVHGKTVIAVTNPKVAFARAATALLSGIEEPRTIHSTAVIAPDVVIGAQVKIGAGAVVESGVTIGDRTILEAGCYVGCNSRIGQDCTIYPKVVIYRNVDIGSHVIIHAGAVIGADGFGFVADGSKYVKFPQIGGVIIEDDVEIGANTCVDRGSLEVTIIRHGTKIDNLVQVGHNVHLGEDTVIAAQTGISGSCRIGAHSIIAGQVGIGEHAELEPGTVLGGQAGVLNSKYVKGGEVLWGTPARPLKQFLTQQAHLSRLPRIYDELKKLRREWEVFKRNHDLARP